MGIDYARYRLRVLRVRSLSLTVALPRVTSCSPFPVSLPARPSPCHFLLALPRVTSCSPFPVSLPALPSPPCDVFAASDVGVSLALGAPAIRGMTTGGGGTNLTASEVGVPSLGAPAGKGTTAAGFCAPMGANAAAPTDVVRRYVRMDTVMLLGSLAQPRKARSEFERCVSVGTVMPENASASGGGASGGGGGAVDALLLWDVFLGDAHFERTVCDAVQLFASPDCSAVSSAFKMGASVKSILLLPYVPCTCSYTSLPCVPPMRPSHASLPCVPPMRPSHASLPCVPPMRPSHAPLSCVPPMRPSHAPLPCAPPPCVCVSSTFKMDASVKSIRCVLVEHALPLSRLKSRLLLSGAMRFLLQLMSLFLMSHASPPILSPIPLPPFFPPIPLPPFFPPSLSPHSFPHASPPILSPMPLPPFFPPCLSPDSFPHASPPILSPMPLSPFFPPCLSPHSFFHASPPHSFPHPSPPMPFPPIPSLSPLPPM
ncbi:unnamed protein product [Closterium sp. NIES-64]|nr:unnamed protein product [Closterium sp. NIES-64]